jgi:hypothetical protein
LRQCCRVYGSMCCEMIVHTTTIQVRNMLTRSRTHQSFTPKNTLRHTKSNEMSIKRGVNIALYQAHSFLGCIDGGRIIGMGESSGKFHDCVNLIAIDNQRCVGCPSIHIHIRSHKTKSPNMVESCLRSCVPLKRSMI